MDAFKAEDECPFLFCGAPAGTACHGFRFRCRRILYGRRCRAETDKMGFCRTHYKKMYDYGNRLGAGLILKTHFQYKTKELHEQIRIFAPSRASVFSRFKKRNTDTDAPKTSLDTWVKEQEDTCYICNFYKDTYARYLNTFFELFKKIRNFSRFLKPVRDFAFPISEIWLKQLKVLYLIKRKKPFTLSFSQ